MEEQKKRKYTKFEKFMADLIVGWGGLLLLAIATGSAWKYLIKPLFLE
jgi:hypothetical protein